MKRGRIVSGHGRVGAPRVPCPRAKRNKLVPCAERPPAPGGWHHCPPGMEPPVCQCPAGSGSWRRRKAGAHRGYPHRRGRNAQHRIGHSSSRASRLRTRGSIARAAHRSLGFGRRAAITCALGTERWPYAAECRTYLPVKSGASARLGSYGVSHLRGDEVPERHGRCDFHPFFMSWPISSLALLHTLVDVNPHR